MNLEWMSGNSGRTFINGTLITSSKFIFLPKLKYLRNSSDQNSIYLLSISDTVKVLQFPTWASAPEEAAWPLHAHTFSGQLITVIEIERRAPAPTRTLTSTTSVRLSVSRLYFQHENSSSPRFSEVSDAPTQTVSLHEEEDLHVIRQE